MAKAKRTALICYDKIAQKDEKGDLVKVIDREKNETELFYTLTDANSKVTRFTYDEFGNVRTVTDAKNNITESIYDEKGQLVTTVYADETTIESDNPRMVTVYDAGGRERASIDAEGVITHYIYDVAGRLVETIYGDEISLSTFLAEMDLGTYQPTEYTLAGVDWTKVLYPVATPLRVLNADLPRTKTEYSEDGRVQAEIDIVVNYSYDDNGNLKTRTEGGETVNYVWDDQNRLVEVQSSSGIVNYVYDDDNIRVSETVGGEMRSYLLDKNRPYAQVLAEYNNGNLDASYVYGLDLISQERGSVDSYYLVDGLGSTRGLTDENGNVTDVYHYDAYGNLTDSVGNSENDYLFAGEQFDESLDQYYLRQRYYDPSVGRFTRRDTYEGDNFDPITLHKYLYAGANPINGIDPSGLFTNNLNEIQVALTILGVLSNSYGLARNTYLALNADNNTDKLIHSIDAGMNLLGLFLPFMGPGASSGLASASGGSFGAAYVANTSRLVGSVLIPTSQAIGSAVFMAAHQAEWELYDSSGNEVESGEVKSGGTSPGRRLNWQEQLLTHTERKVLSALEGSVNEGDIVVVRGTLPPCNPGNRGCQRAMQEFANKKNVTVIYEHLLQGNRGNFKPYIYKPQ
ncbi:RHS repeat-associated core domain-containing protein [Spirulina sp. 06S082]|uniref:RHS repeat-associated core domain-containing protein n=1 Tax=Spirulina sp. 06S082 TaxID=3110248 RepID=UPI002B216FB7|nr:RHS repeat-associated core domain-containing protein [Spirulina sp. 06S082]MEA5471827.1 RHS repeat-associated core domain-containing protein [Spirulina sp. 06S082]